MQDPVAAELLTIINRAKQSRANWDNQFQQVVNFVRPSADDFQGSQTRGGERTNQIYDSTAVDALEEFASFLHSFLTNPVDRWFNLRPTNPNIRLSKRMKIWLGDANETIYHYYGSSKSGFNQSLNENFFDIGSFGTSCVHQYWKDGLKFKTFSLADIWIKENEDRVVDTVIRRVPRTGRQLMQQFAGKLPHALQEQVDKRGMDAEFTIYHVVMPRSDAHFLKKVKINKAFSSLWVCENTKEMISDKGGYDHFPYHVPRWVKLSNEVWGRSPALKALPDIKMLNRLEFNCLKAVSKAVDPPLIVPSEAFLVPLKTGPGAVNYREPSGGNERIEQLEISRGYPMSEQKAEQKRESIRKMFYNDLIRLEKENVEMTAYEAQDRSERKLRLVAPMLSRQEAELLGPMISLSYLLCAKHGEIPPPPERIPSLAIEYTSPASRAQTGMRAFAMDRYIQRLIPSMQLNPEISQVIDWDYYTQKLGEYMGTDPELIRDPKALAEMREASAQQAQADQMMAAAEPASKAIKNLNDAGISPQSLIQ